MNLKRVIYLLIILTALGVAVFISVEKGLPEPVNQQVSEETVSSPGSGDATDIIKPDLVEEPVPVMAQLEVPFTPQAPFANWSDKRYQNACEEASILMAWKWIRGETLSAFDANQTMAEMVDFQQKNYGFFIDSSAEDTARLFRDYFQYENVFTDQDVTVESIKREIARGNLVIVPADGTRLGNPNFTPPGPLRHMLVITGFDEQKQIFITNDPGTRNGEGYEYSYNVLINAVRDYPSGDHVPIVEVNKKMIIVVK